MSFYYQPLDKACKSKIGALACGDDVTFHIRYDESGEEIFSATVCYIDFYQDDGQAMRFAMHRDNDGFTVTLQFSECGLWFYYFTIGDGKYLGRGKLRSGEVCEHPESWQITVHRKSYQTPEWFKGGIMYQIFPDRFYKSGSCPIKLYKFLHEKWGEQPNFRPNEFGKILNNDFFGGNLNGIREKLDYLNSLHVKTIYLNPIFEAYSNHRYDTGDYLNIDSLLGTKEDFCNLIREAKEKDIRIVLDGVFNHTGDDSRYFNKYGRYESLGAYQSSQSPYSEWYSFHPYPDCYDSWWGIETLPAVNEYSASYRNFICGEGGVLKTWLKCGVSGYRLDVADELPDFFLQDIRQAVKEENSQALIIGEVWEDASNKIAYSQRRKYLQGEELDSVMNYPIKDAIIKFVLTKSTCALRETIAMLIDNYPKETLDCLMNIIGTHDTVRILTVMGGKTCSSKEEMSRTALTERERAKAMDKVRMAAVLQYTLPGVPCIYYGDEVGMEGYSDPFCRGCFPWDNVNEELLQFYRKLGEIRTCDRLNEIFKDGNYFEVFADSHCIVFGREKSEKRIFVWCNNSSERYLMRLGNGKYRECISGKIYKDFLEINEYGYGILSSEE